MGSAESKGAALTIFLVLQHLTSGSTFILSMIRHASSGDLRDYCYLLAIILGWSPADAHWVSSYEGNATSLSNDKSMERRTYPSEQMDMFEIPFTHEDQCPNPVNDWNDSAPQNQGISPFSERMNSLLPQQSDTFTPATTTNLSDTSHHLNKRQCPYCFRPFSTVSNLGKHVRTDCKAKYGKQRFSCGNLGCTKMLSRKAYRDIHQRDKCLFRSDGA